MTDSVILLQTRPIVNDALGTSDDLGEMILKPKVRGEAPVTLGNNKVGLYVQRMDRKLMSNQQINIQDVSATLPSLGTNFLSYLGEDTPVDLKVCCHY